MAKKSQSLIETIVAIGILVTGIVAILSIGLTDISLGQQSGKRVQAISLAREGLGIVESIRSSNWLNPENNWPYGIATGNYYVDFQTTSLNEATFVGGVQITDCTNCYLCQDEANGYFYQCADSGAEFSRLITITNGDDLGGNCENNCEKKIISKVYWDDKGKGHSISLENHLTNWRESD